MKGVMRICMAVVIAVAITGAVCAQGPWGGYGMGYGKGVNIEAMQKFRAETLNLRDGLNTKHLELMNEYSKPELNMKRIATLRKEIIDLEAKIQAVAEKYDIPMGGMMGPGMMMGAGSGMMMQMCPMGWW